MTGQQISESGPTISTVPLGAFKYGEMIYVTRELAEDVAFDLLGYLGEQAGRSVGTGFGTHTVTGTGTGQPRGITLDAAGGVTGATTGGGILGDELFDLYHSVGEAYARSESAAWVMNSKTLATVRKLKGSTHDHYLFDVEIPAGSGASGPFLAALSMCPLRCRTLAFPPSRSSSAT